MSLSAFDIPESQSDIPTWIESVMCEGNLRSLVAQLHAVAEHGPTSTDDSTSSADDGTLSLDELLGDHRRSVLSDGLSALPGDVVTSLLRQPSKLLLLQELTMLDGSSYWQQRYVSPGNLEQEVVASRQQIDAAIDESESTSGASAKSKVTRPSPATESSPSSNLLLRWLAVAAAVLLAVGIWLAVSSDQTKQQQVAQQPTPTADQQGNDGQPVEGIGWGWASEKGVPADLSGRQYLQALSSGAASWGKKQPADKEALLKRLKEFRAGCNRLANMDHPNLKPNDQQWLVKSCQGWLSQIDQLVDTADQMDFKEIQQQANALAAAMEAELQKRAELA